MIPTETEIVTVLVIPKLTVLERQVHEYIFGIHKPKLKPLAISKRMNISASKVSKVRHSIWNKIKVLEVELGYRSPGETDTRRCGNCEGRA